MKKNLQLFRARWLLLVTLLLCVSGVNAQDTWYLFDDYIKDGTPRATFSDPDADGNYVAKYVPGNGSTNTFAFVNSINPTTDKDTATFLGSAAGNVTVSAPATYDLVEIDYSTLWGVQNVFTITDTWVITFNPTTMKVTFALEEAPGLPDEAPAMLYFVDYVKSFASADNDGNGVFEFKGVEVEPNQYPFYGFSDTSNPRNASVMASAAPAMYATTENNVNIELGKEYDLALSSWAAINDMVGSFVVAEGLYDITVDWTKRTVTFTEGVVTLPAAPDKLYLVDWQNSFGEATNDGNGVFVFDAVSVPSNQYPYYGFADNSVPRNAGMIVSAVKADEAESSNNVNVELDEVYPVALSNFEAIDGCRGTYMISPGTYHITVDWNAMTVTFTKPEIKAPDVLYIIDYQTSFGSAINNGNDVYEFEDIVLTSGFPYYGFAPAETPATAAWAIGTVDYATAQSGGHHGYNIEVVPGEEYTFDFTDPQAMYDEIGSFVLGSTPINITLDWNKGTVKFWTKPLEQPATLYATDTYLEDMLGSCRNNGYGVYNMVVNVAKSSSIVVFTNSTDFKNTEGETLYYGTADGAISDVEYETEYTLGGTDYNTVWGDATGLRLAQGRYKIDVDFVGNTITVHDISRGDVWTIPETLDIYNDEMERLATGERIEEGVFRFDNVVLSKSSNIVFTDNPTAMGKFFGSSMNGDRSTDVKNYRTYELYIPTYQEITVDGLAGFRVPEGTWSIKVDLNEKNVSFVDPDAVYFPEQLEVVADSEPTSNLAEGNATYVWKLNLTQETAVTFADQLTGRTYGSPAADITVEAGKEYEAGELAGDALNAFSVPAGIWEVVFELKNGKITFYEYQAITLVESTHNDGDKFYSYFGAGTEPVMTLTFTGNPYTVAEAFLAFGDYTPGMKADTETCKLEEINVYRAGNTLMTSFAGKARSIPEGAEESKVTLVISTIKSVHGLLAETEAIEGLPAGSLMYTFDFEEFKPIAIESKLLDEAGNDVSDEEIVNVDEMETLTLMVKPYGLITFDGVTLTPAAKTDSESPAPAAITPEWEAGEENAEGFTPIRVKLPMSIRGTGAWNLSLANLDADDNTGAHGEEVNYTILSQVNPADVVTADPESGSTLDVLHEIKLTWNHALVKSVGYHGDAEPEITVTDANGDTYPARLRVLSSIGDNELLIQTESEIVKAGKYSVEIPAGTVVLNDDTETDSNAIVLEYVVTGVNDSVNDILADDPDAEVIVCTLSGVVIRKGRAADVLKNLSEGIYIINGAKTLIR